MFDLTHLFIGTALAQSAAPAGDSAGSPSSIGMSFLPLLLMIYWLIRVRFAKAWKKISKEKPVELVHA